MDNKCFSCHRILNDKDKEIGIKLFDNHILCVRCSSIHLENQKLSVCTECQSNCPIVLLDDAYYKEEDNLCIKSEICPSCYRKYMALYPHDYKPIPVFSKENERKNNLHIGVELEIQHHFLDTQNAMPFKRFFNSIITEDNFYLKYDGSLDEDYGVEIVSQPMTYNDTLSKWHKCFTLMEEYNMVETSDCGIHCHIDKAYLSNDMIRNLDYIVNTFVDTIYRIGKRDIICHEWANHLNKPFYNWGRETEDDGKYHAFHFCKNTIELRCFESTNNEVEFKTLMNHVFALVEYVKDKPFNFFTDLTDESFYNKFMLFSKNYQKKMLNNI